MAEGKPNYADGNYLTPAVHGMEAGLFQFSVEASQTILTGEAFLLTAG